MIERIVIENFKSLRKVELRLGRLNFFIGTNASGKSNFFDALLVLRDIAGGASVSQAFSGTLQRPPHVKLLCVRGGLAQAAYRPAGSLPTETSEIAFRVRLVAPSKPALDYEFAFDSEGVTTRESLQQDGRAVFTFKGVDGWFHRSSGGQVPIYPNPVLGSQLLLAYLTGLAGEHKSSIVGWQRGLSMNQFLSLDPFLLRGYGEVGTMRLGERGQDLACVVRSLCGDPQAKAAYLSWLQALRPEQVEDVDTKPGAQDEPMFRLREGGREFLAPVLSEGTLRFAALAAAFFQTELPPLLAIEEVDNGVHASRLRLLVELLRSQAAQGKVQVIATTHSPIVLGWLKPEEHATTFYCRQDEQTGESRICPLTEIPRLADLSRKQPVSELFAEGWLEAAL
jgi:predicted ATPase